MKIYHKPSFMYGLTFLFALPLFTFGIIKVHWWQWIITIAFATKFLYTGLSKSESEYQENIAKNYRSVAQELYGKYATIKLNFPLVILCSFYAVALFIRLVADLFIPIWITVCFTIVLTVSVFYSLSLNHKIKEHIENGTNKG